ncbi:hypothetical protein ACS0TY_019603 [Phlomoides rotata]
MIHQILLLFLISPVIIIHSKNSCPTSICSFANSLQIQYPFKQTDHLLPKECHNFINLRCDDQGQAVINLPSSGEFYVTSIDYIFQRIALTDPGNCLLGRLMVSNITPYPLEAYLYENYTYYTCPKERITYPFTEIHCLSNSVNATIATTVTSSKYMKEKYGCTPIVSSMIPVSRWNEYNISGNFGDLQLTWNIPECRQCYDSPPSSDGSKSKVPKLFQSPVFITAVSLLATFSGIACLLRLTAVIADTGEDAATTESSAGTSTAVAPPPQATAGNENSQVKNFSEVELHGESKGTLVSCSICLEEYNGKDKVRNLNQCGHYFHVECIDQWLQKNSSCPVCRTSLS